MSKTANPSNPEPGYSPHERGIKLLDAVLKPGYFMRNPFRVLELPVNTSPRDWERRLKIVLLAEKNAMAIPSGPGCILPLHPQPDSHQVREARYALDDPRTALVARLLWFWPLTSDDAGFKALAAGDTGTAIDAWNAFDVDHSSPEDRVAAKHNLAVLYLLSATSMTESDEEGDHADASEVWGYAFQAWQSLLSNTNPSFWPHAVGRLIAGDSDPRLVGVCEALEASFPQILAEMPLHYLLADAAEHAQKHDWLIQSSKQSEFDHASAAKSVAQAIAGKIKGARAAAIKDAETRPTHADHSCRSFLGITRPLINALDQLLPEQDSLKIKMHDEVASGVLSCQIDYANATDDWETSIDLLKSVEGLAGSQEVKQQIERNIAKVREIAEETSRWRASGYATLPANVHAEMDKAKDLLDKEDEAGAIRAVAALYANYQGTPKGRIFEVAIAYALNRRALRLDKDAFNIFNVDPPTLGRFKRSARNDPYAALGAKYSSFITCHACGNSIYSQYYTVTIGGVKGIQCPSCNSAIDREIEAQKDVLRKALVAPTSDVMLAQELNPTSKILKKNWEIFSTQATKYMVNVPSSTLPLRMCLGIATSQDLTKAVRHSDKRTSKAAWEALEKQDPATAAKLHKSIATRRLIFAATVATLIVAATAFAYHESRPEVREQRAWSESERAANREAVQSFLAEWPSGAHAGKAHEWLATDDMRLERVAWNRAETTNTVVAYKNYLTHYPSGTHSAEAKDKADDATWAAVKRTAAAKEYLNSYPAGHHATEAKTMIDRTEWQEAAAASTEGALAAYIRDHSDGAFLAEAQKALGEKIALWAGPWRDENDKIVHTVTVVNGEPLVVSVIKDSGINLPVSDVSWRDGKLTWSYTRRGDDGSMGKVTFIATGVSGDKMQCKWKSYETGTCFLKRVSRP